MNDDPVPRILVIDDLYGRTHPDARNEDRANLCGQYLIADVTDDEGGMGVGQQIVRPVASAVFRRGQKPVCSVVGDTVENDLRGTMDIIRNGWLGSMPWAMVLLDLCFYTGRVTSASDGSKRGMPEGRDADDSPDGYFGLQILRSIQDDPDLSELPVVILSSMSRTDVSREITHRGAKGFIPRDQGTPDILDDYLTRHGLIPDPDQLIIGRSRRLLIALRDARQFARSRQPVLIRGESGTGKELFARFIHQAGANADGPYVQRSLAAIPATLAEDTLFGHLRGAFDGAKSDRKGAFEEANQGTLFLDEVGDTPTEVQPKLLRAVEYGEIQRLGSDAIITVDTRVLSATEVDIEGNVAAGAGFRPALLYRLRMGGTLILPPLRDRKEDILFLATTFIEQAVADTPGALQRELDPEALDCLVTYDWPNNVRELRSVVFNAVQKYPDVEHVVQAHLQIAKPVATEKVAPTVINGRPPVETFANDLHRDIDGLIKSLESFSFESLEASNLVGSLPRIENAFARLLARYLVSALKANIQKRTAQNPRGKVRISPAVAMMEGHPLHAAKAADIIKNILSKRPEAIAPLLNDPADSVLKEALDVAVRLRPRKRKNPADPME